MRIRERERQGAVRQGVASAGACEQRIRILPSSSSSEVMDLDRMDRAVVGALFGGGGAEGHRGKDVEAAHSSLTWFEFALRLNQLNLLPASVPFLRAVSSGSRFRLTVTTLIRSRFPPWRIMLTTCLWPTFTTFSWFTCHKHTQGSCEQLEPPDVMKTDHYSSVCTRRRWIPRQCF